MFLWLIWVYGCVLLAREFGGPIRVWQAIQFVLLLLGLFALLGLFGGTRYAALSSAADTVQAESRLLAARLEPPPS
jgi:hypothetical protein